MVTVMSMTSLIWIRTCCVIILLALHKWELQSLLTVTSDSRHATSPSSNAPVTSSYISVVSQFSQHWVILNNILIHASTPCKLQTLLLLDNIFTPFLPLIRMSIQYLVLLHTASLSLDEPCTGNRECVVRHSLCLPVDAAQRDMNFTCQCKQGYEPVDGRCLPRKIF